MSKLISLALCVLFVVFIVNNVKEIFVKIKTNRAEKAKENEKECDTVNLESEEIQ